RFAPRTILLIQDPTMQRRTDASFRHVWRDVPEVRFLNWPTFTPRVRHMAGRLQFDNPGVSGLWPLDRFLSLLMGEIPRLRNDSFGYGPNGRNFIAAIDLPAAIEAAYAQLKDRLGARAGDRATVTPTPS